MGLFCVGFRNMSTTVATKQSEQPRKTSACAIKSASAAEYQERDRERDQTSPQETARFSQFFEPRQMMMVKRSINSRAVARLFPHRDFYNNHGGSERLYHHQMAITSTALVLLILCCMTDVSMAAFSHHYQVSPLLLSSSLAKRRPSLLTVSSSSSSSSSHHYSRTGTLTSSPTTAVSSSSSSSSRLYYRNRHDHEEQHTTTTTTAPSSSSSSTTEAEQNAASSSSFHHDNQVGGVYGSVNLVMITHLIKSQLQILAVATVVTFSLVLWQATASGLLVGGDWSAAALLDGLNWAPPPLLSLGSSAASATSTTTTSFLAQTLLQGIATAIPMIYIGDKMEASSLRDMSRVNFATTNMVVTLFGRRRKPRRETTSIGNLSSVRLSSTVTALMEDHASLLSRHPTRILSVDKVEENEKPMIHEGTRTLHVIFYSFLLATTTAICEEGVFRGYIPATIMHFLTGTTLSLTAVAATATGNMSLALVTGVTLVTLLGQAILFGLAHVHPHSRLGENVIVTALQSLSGLIYGLAYCFTGGNILVGIVAHTLYDTHVLCETWHQVNQQMDYTEQKCISTSKSLHDGDNDALQLLEMQRQAGAALSDENLTFLRRFFYAFDSTHVGTLSMDDVQRAVTYAFLHDDDDNEQEGRAAAAVPTQAQVHQMFLTVLAQRRKQQQQEKSSSPPEEERLRLSEFLRLLFSLRAQAHHHHQQQAITTTTSNAH